MRILLVTRNLPPLVGGMERLNWHMAEELARYAEVRVVGPAGSARTAPAGVTVREAPLKPLWRFLMSACWLAVREARRWRPDVVLAGSGLTAPLVWLAARACGARPVAYVHGLDIVAPHWLYRRLWLPALRRMDHVIANSRATAQLAEQAGIAPRRLAVVHPGVTAPHLRHDGEVAARTRSELGLGTRPVLLSVGRMTARKGLREFVSKTLPLIAARCPDIVLVIVGDVPANALHAPAQTPAGIQATAAQAGVDGHIRFLGKLPEQKLAAIYKAADVHVFPVLEIPNDPEGFGMVSLEAAAHGLPTVAFAAGGAAEAVAEGQSGHVVTAGDYAAFAAAVLDILATNQDWKSRCRSFAEQFAWPVFGKRLSTELLDRTAAVPDASEKNT